MEPFACSKTVLIFITISILSTSLPSVESVSYSSSSSSSSSSLSWGDRSNYTLVGGNNQPQVRARIVEIKANPNPSLATQPPVLQKQNNNNNYNNNNGSGPKRSSISTSASSTSSHSSSSSKNLADSIPSQSKNKPLLNALVNKLESLGSKLDRLGEVQNLMQKSFDSLESRFSLSSTMDDIPQCGRRVDRVLRTLTPLVSRVEGLWNVVAGQKSVNSNNQSPPQSVQFLGPPSSNDVLLSESRRQERAISAIKSESRQIINELGTVEQQLELIQNNLGIRQQQKQPNSIDSASDIVADVQNSNDVTLSISTEGLSNVNNLINGTFVRGGPAIVFPSVKNKPSGGGDISIMDGADALLTGSGQRGSSCSEMLMQGSRRSGLYHVKIPGARSSFWQLLVYCEQEIAGGGWMVIQRRADFGEPRESFHRNWVEYRSGFGDPLRELWMGNLNLHLLTNSEDQVLRVELEDFDGEKRHAEYSTFRVASEGDGFRIEVGGYSGDAGDALSDPWYGAHSGQFSTHDRDNDRSSLNCASMLKGGWWWKSCGRGLNGLYFDAQQPDSALARQGIVWFRWKGWDYTLKKATMMIRPKSFRPFNSTNFY